eukprot:12890786-Prorocentrum_lima.AAC.1
MMVLATVVVSWTVIQEDAILKRVWLDKTIQHTLRTPQSKWEVLSFVKIMTGEVRVRAHEEE